MPVVQATLSFVLELGEFHNVDLYHRGFYQIRTYFKANGQSSSNTTVNQSSSKFCVVVEPPTLWRRSNTRVLVPEAVHPSFVEPRQVNPVYVPDKMCSKTLRIMYREESVKLHDVFEQRLLIQVDPSKLEQSVLKHEVFLCVELWFAEEGSHNTFSVRSLEKVYERQLRVQLTPTRGLHHHFDVFFDYFHLCAVEMGLHGALTNVSPSIIR
ncbi:putative Serine esterase [Fasciola gigantica]|uniref:Putative Serine esterase n=1 Tax=Fasciola gigantica TaxID=46835 RepID=A0A504YBP1_FASGI|nr:putative Serine esterase [Fasciola gigantica]